LLTISKRKVTLTSQSGSKTYDGKPLTASEVTVSGDGFVEGEAAATATGSITDVGSARNTIAVNGTSSFKESNYLVTKSEGTLTVKAPDTVPMYRLYNPWSGEHFYTSSASERDAIVASGWKYEGVGWTAPAESSKPVYRLYSGTDHHYTMDAGERDYLVSAGWKYEGIGWYSDEAEGTPLYRQYNPYVDPNAATNNSGSHNYTTSRTENDALVRAGWKAEGIAWYGLKTD
jgi:hypothetical protein